MGLVVLVLLATHPERSQGEEPLGLEPGDRVVFFGDSITQAGQYVVDIELFLLTRFPDHEFTIINHGISSQTVSGLSEPDHNPPRENALDRFDRDVVAWKPDVVVACFGMNDGIYHPFDEERFAPYQQGIRRLIDGTRDADARIVLLTPPPFDPYRRRSSDPDAVHFGYKFPYINYDSVLGRYADWLVTLRDRGIPIADVHTATNRHLARRRRDRVSFHLAPDSVHPDATGHWLMAQTLLLTWKAPSLVDEALVDARNEQSTSNAVRDITTNDAGVVSFRWTTKLPYPVDPQCDPELIRLERVPERLNRHQLTVKGLQADRYQIEARELRDVSGSPSGEDARYRTLSPRVSSPGRNSRAASTSRPSPISRRPGLLRTFAPDSRRIVKETYQRWRERINDPDRSLDPDPDPIEGPALASIRRLCQPRQLEIRLVPVETRD